MVIFVIIPRLMKTKVHNDVNTNKLADFTLFLFCNMFGIMLVTYVHLFILGCAPWQWNPADVL